MSDLCTPLTGKHTDFLGWTVTSPDSYGVHIPVRAADPGSNCEMCPWKLSGFDNSTINGSAAEYKIAGVEALGHDGGVDVLYCHEHLQQAINLAHLSGDRWFHRNVITPGGSNVHGVRVV